MSPTSRISLGAVWQWAKSNQLVSNASIYVGGTLLQKAFSFLLIPLYLHYLTPEDYGIVGLATAVYTVLSILVGLGLYGAVSRLYHDHRDQPAELRRYLTSNMLFLAAIALGLSLLLDQFGAPVWSLVTSGNIPFSPYVRLMIWISFGAVLYQLPITVYQTAQRPVAFVIANLCLFLATAAAVIYFVAVRRMGAHGQLLGHMLANLATAGVLVVLLFKDHFTWRFDLGAVRKSLAYSLPLIPHSVAGWAMTAINRVLLESGVTLAALGVYNLAYQLGLVMSILVSSVNQAWLPYYFSTMKRNPRPGKTVRQVVMVYTTAMGGICLLGSLFSPEFVRWLAPDRYQGAERYVPPILFAYLLQGFYYFASSPLFYYKTTRVVPVMTFAGAGVNILLNLWWIPLYGALGSSWAITAAFAVLFIIAYFLGRRYQKIDLPIPKLASLVGINLLGVVFSSFSAFQADLTLGWLAAVKVIMLALYGLLVYLWFVRPYWLARAPLPERVLR